MLRNYLRVAFRHLRKQPGYSVITIGSLGIGLACAFLIVLFIQHETSFDRFHTTKDRTYRLLVGSTGDQGVEMQAITASGFAPDMTDAFPEIEKAVRIFGTRPYLRPDHQAYAAEEFLFADAAFFEVFSFDLLRGDPTTVLDAPNALVLTESSARQIFGGVDVIGETVSYDDRFDLQVTGIAADPPQNSHLRFGYVANFESIKAFMGADALNEYTNYNYNTYFLLAAGTDARSLEARFPAFLEGRFSDEEASQRVLRLQPVTDIHLTTDIRWDVATNTDPKYIYMLGVVGVLLLVIACVNFMNLATARSTRRAREVGVRKAIGADRRSLIGQFIGESLLLSACALLLSLVLSLAAIPIFRHVVDSEITLASIDSSSIAALIGIGLLAGLAAGAYPAFYLSAFRPSRVLKGELSQGKRGAILRKSLIVIQFTISVFLIIGTFTIYRQLDYVRSKELGFDKEHVAFARMVAPLRDQYEIFRERALSHSGVMHVSRAGNVPGRVNTSRGYNWPGQEAGTEEGRGFYTVLADYDYLDVLGLELVHGRDFSRDRPTDVEDAYILNETAAKELGWDRPIGQPFRAWDREMGTVIGVVADFHFKSLHQQIEPVVINIKPDWTSYVVVRLAPGNVRETVADLRREWEALAPGFSFDYQFLDQDFDRLYRAEQDLGQLFTFFAAVAILVGCLGLFGIAAYSAERRRKEIGVRKTLGAGLRSIVLLLTKEFTMLIVVAIVVAAPIAYVVLNGWLSDFAYRTSPGVLTFAGSAAIVLCIGWLTVGYQSLKAAMADPIESLRYE